MKLFHGIGVSGGIAIGNLAVYSEKRRIQKSGITNVESEIARLESAQKMALDAISSVYLQSVKQVGEENAMIFQIHMMMIQDEDFSNAIREKIVREHVNAEYAVWTVAQDFSQYFAKMDDSEYMRGRKTDVIDIARRLIGCLSQGSGSVAIRLEQPAILAAAELTPSETIQLDRSKVLAIVTQQGSRTSHASILARTMGIPAIVGLGDDFRELKSGLSAVVDGSSGKLILSPDEPTARQAEKRRSEALSSQRRLKEALALKPEPANGRGMAVYANIGHPSDVEKALEYGAEGVGLFRSEFLYLDRDSLPSEEEQFQAYRQVLEKMHGKPVIIRTFDIGADKRIPYLNLPQETNPALGYRAIRICLDRVELFRTQLRALMRSSVYGNLKIMFPLITSVEELQQAKAVLEQVRHDLTEEMTAYSRDVKVGTMIETPAAVLLGDELGKECDFFSIGTNDLTQYTLAVDRMNGKLSKLYSPKHPAVLKMLEMTASSAKQAGIPVGICGEMAADPDLIEFYQKIGIDELSMALTSILKIKEKIYGL